MIGNGDDGDKKNGQSSGGRSLGGDNTALNSVVSCEEQTGFSRRTTAECNKSYPCTCIVIIAHSKAFRSRPKH